MSSTVAATTVASIVGGEARQDAPGGRLTSTNPARLDDVVAEVLLGDASVFVDAARHPCGWTPQGTRGLRRFRAIVSHTPVVREMPISGGSRQEATP